MLIHQQVTLQILQKIGENIQTFIEEQAEMKQHH